MKKLTREFIGSPLSCDEPFDIARGVIYNRTKFAVRMEKDEKPNGIQRK
jgi:hypothetical protein